MTPTIIAKWSVTALLAVATAFAQDLTKATIPFDFTVGRTNMTAGAYTVRSIVPGTIQLVRDDHKASVIALTNGVQARKTPAGSSLVFTRYGNSYFLSRVWTAGSSTGRELPKSKLEIEVARVFKSGPVVQASVPATAASPLASSR